MSSEQLLDEAKFWEIVKYLVDLDYKKDFDEICNDLNITNRKLNSYVSFLKEVNYQFDTENFDGEGKKLCPPKEKPEINLKFSLLEWLQFQAHFPVLAQCNERPYHSDVKSLLAKAENEHGAHDLFNPALALEEILESNKLEAVEQDKLPQGEIISFIEECILDKKVLNLKSENKNIMIYPWKIVYLDGELSLIGEGLNDKCLINLSINSIGNVFEEETTWEAVYSKIEVDDFIASIRAITDNEVRLVLKVSGRDNFSQSIPHHHLVKPCMFTNSNGDFIWAASIEPNEAIYDWLNALGGDVEILDPIDFKKEYLTYCEHKLKKLA
jgi:hypothetical protein